MLGALAFRDKDCELAVTHFKQSWEAINGRPEALIEYVDCLFQTRRLEEAIPVFNRITELLPSNWHVRYDLAVVQFRANHNVEADVHSRLQESPDDPILNYLLAEILSRKGVQPGTLEFQEAVSAARRSIQRNPDFVLAHNVLSKLYLRAGMAHEAIAQSRLVLKADPNDQAALYHLIMALRKSGNSSEIPALVQRLAQATTSAREREADINRFKLVEQGVKQDKDTTSSQRPGSTAN